MEKRQTLEIIKTVETYYQNKFKVDDPKAILEAWHNILQEYEFDIIQANLMQYVKTNRFAPSVADLINAEPQKDRALPDYEETRAMMAKWDEEKKNKASQEQAEQHLAAMRKILGINRG